MNTSKQSSSVKILEQCIRVQAPAIAWVDPSREVPNRRR